MYITLISFHFDDVYALIRLRDKKQGCVVDTCHKGLRMRQCVGNQSTKLRDGEVYTQAEEGGSVLTRDSTGF